MARDRPEAGFTLVELLIVVAIVGILATIGASVYRKWITRSKASGEVPHMLGHFQQREEAYMAENGAYLATGASDSDYFPRPLAGGGSYTTLETLPDSWQKLHVQPGQNGLYCGYVVITGAQNVMPGGDGAALWSETPTRDWFYVRAECNWDGNDSVNNTWVLRGDLGISTAIQTGEGR